MLLVELGIKYFNSNNFPVDSAKAFSIINWSNVLGYLQKFQVPLWVSHRAMVIAQSVLRI